MASAFPQSLAVLIGFWLNSFLHGIYLTLFIQWATEPRHRSAALYFVAFCWLAFLTSNIDFGINLYLMMKGFWFSLPHGGPDVLFAEVQNWPTVIREITSQLMVTTGDTLMIYRLYIIWGRNIYIIILPTSLLIAETACGCLSLALLSLGRLAGLANIITLLLALNTTVQIVLAVLIAVRLLDPKDMKYLQKDQRTRRFQLVRCLIESGLLVAVALTIDLILFVRKMSFHWVFNICFPQIYAITTVLIILRMDSFTDRQRSAMSSSLPSDVRPTSHLRGVAPLVPRSPISVNMSPSSRTDGSRKLQIEDSHDGIELKGYHEERCNMRTTDVYVHVESEVHYEV